MSDLKERAEKAKAEAEKILNAIKRYGDDDYVPGAVIRFDDPDEEDLQTYIAVKSDDFVWLLINASQLTTRQLGWEALIEFVASSDKAVTLWYASEFTEHIPA